jgi:hypothetical protein
LAPHNSGGASAWQKNYHGIQHGFGPRASALKHDFQKSTEFLDELMQENKAIEA